MWLRLLSFSAFAMGCIYPCTTIAETLRLTNGDTLHVSITSIKKKTLIAQNRILGELTIPLVNIKSIAFKGSYWVRVKGGTEFHLINFKQSGEQFFTTKDQDKGIRIADLGSLAELEKTQPPALAKAVPDIIVTKKQPVIESKPLVQPPISKITDAVKTGTITAQDLEEVDTNTWLYSNQVAGYINFDDIGKKDDKSVTLSGDGISQARNTENRHTVKWAFENTSEKGKHDEAYAFGYDYNHFLGPKKFLFVNSSYDYDDNDMPYRLIKSSTGLGFQVFDNNRLSLHIEGGPGYTIQSYRQQSNLYSASAFIGIVYNQTITDDVSIFNDVNLNYTLKNGSAILDGKLGIKYQITSGLWFEIVHNYIWNTDPEDGYNNYNGNVKLGLGIGW